MSLLTHKLDLFIGVIINHMRPTKEQKKDQHAYRKKEIDETAMKNIYSMIDRQETTITNLLNKYSDQNYDNFQLNQQKKVIQSKTQNIQILNLPNSFKTSRISRQERPDTRFSLLQEASKKSDRDSISLPIVYQKRRLNKSRSRKKRNKANSTLENPRNSLDVVQSRAKLQGQLYKIYGSFEPTKIKGRYDNDIAKSKKSKSKQKVKKRHKARGPKKLSPLTPIEKMTIEQNATEGQHVDYIDTYEEERQNQIDVIESEDSSENEEMPAEYYEKEFRKIMVGQLRQQMNYLFFSKNETTKEWSENLLSLIQKHDKQVYSLRKRTKYLESFDQNFFSFGIHNNF